MIVTLTWPEVNLACQEASKRATQNRELRTRHKQGLNVGFFDGLRIDVLGCLGEIAVAKGLNRSWSGQHEMRSPDAAGCIEVKTIDAEHKNLFIYMDPTLNQPEFSVLAYVASPVQVHVNGWIYTQDGKHERYLFEHRQGHPAYLVPQKDLQPMRDLIRILAERDIAAA